MQATVVPKEIKVDDKIKILQEIEEVVAQVKEVVLEEEVEVDLIREMFNVTIVTDWGGSIDDRKSTYGNCFSFSSGLITWNSKKQSIVALSSIEVEYVAVTSTGTQTLWLRDILEEIGEKQIQPTMIYCDNVSAIKLAKNPVHHSRTKHFDMKYHFIRDLVQKKDIDLKHINTQHHLSDIFTKAVAKTQFLALRGKIVDPH
eukprot:PITA_29235